MGKEARWKNPSLGREFLGKRDGRGALRPPKICPLTLLCCLIRE